MEDQTSKLMIIQERSTDCETTAEDQQSHSDSLIQDLSGQIPSVSHIEELLNDLDKRISKCDTTGEKSEVSQLLGEQKLILLAVLTMIDKMEQQVLDQRLVSDDEIVSLKNQLDAKLNEEVRLNRAVTHHQHACRQLEEKLQDALKSVEFQTNLVKVEKLERKRDEDKVEELQEELDKEKKNLKQKDKEIAYFKEQVKGTLSFQERLESDLQRVIIEKEDLFQANEQMARKLVLCDQREEYYKRIKQWNQDLRSDFDFQGRQAQSLQTEVDHLKNCLKAVSDQIIQKDLYIEDMERQSCAATTENNDLEKLQKQSSLASSVVDFREMKTNQLTTQPLPGMQQSYNSIVSPSQQSLLRRSTLNPKELLRHKSIQVEKLMQRKQTRAENNYPRPFGDFTDETEMQRRCSQQFHRKQRSLQGQLDEFLRPKLTLDCQEEPKIVQPGRLDHKQSAVRDFQAVPGQQSSFILLEKSMGTESNTLAHQLLDCNESFNFMMRTGTVKTILENDENMNSDNYQPEMINIGSPIKNTTGSLLQHNLSYSASKMTPISRSPQARTRLASLDELSPCVGYVPFKGYQSRKMTESMGSGTDDMLHSKIQIVSNLISRIEGSFAESTSADQAIRGQLTMTQQQQQQRNPHYSNSNSFSDSPNNEIVDEVESLSKLQVIGATPTVIKNTGFVGIKKEHQYLTPVVDDKSHPLSNLHLQRQTTQFETNASEAIPTGISFEPAVNYNEKLRGYQANRKSRKARTLASDMLNKLLVSKSEVMMDPESTMRSVFANQQVFSLQKTSKVELVLK